MEESLAASAGPSGSKTQGPCRICLQVGTLSIYDKRGFNMIKAIKFFTGLTILKNDLFPKLICNNCYTLLRGAVTFRRNARKSHQLLKEQCKSIDNVNYILDSFIIPQSNTGKNSPTSDSSASNSSQETPMNYSDSDLDVESKNIKSEPMSESDIKIDGSKTIKVQCKECFRFVPKSYLNGHMAEHNGIMRPDGKLECKLCNKVMLRKSFKNHIAIMHSESETPKHVCEQCGRVFTHQGSYIGHLNTHKTEFPFKCDQCDYRGATESYLRAHKRIHNKELRYQCSECAQIFTNKGNLSQHMHRHEGKNMKCSDCDKCFYTKAEVDKHHEVEHLGIKRYACNICNKMFGYRSSMMKHTLGVHKRPSLGHGRTPCYLQKELKNNYPA